MPYVITKSDGTTLTTIGDGLVDDKISSSLTLPGPNSIGYGPALNENLVHILENFCANTPPSGTNIQGQLWFNKDTQTLNVFTTQGYQPVNGLIISSSQPLTALAGNTWYNIITNQYYFYDGTSWQLIGPLYTKAMGPSGAIPITVNDQNVAGVTHNIVKIQFGNQTLAIFSSDPAFVSATPIDGFSYIYKGLTLNNNLFPGSNQFYTNANTAAYLPTDPTIISIQNNVATNLTTTNANIVSANTAVVAYVNNQISATNSAWTANAAVQEIEISGLRANINAANVSITAAWTANAVSQQTQINTLIAGAYANSNVAAYLTTNSGQITAPTQSYSTSNTAVATTAFVQSVFPRGMIMMWNSTAASIPAGFQLCDGTNGTPDLRGQFIIGAGGTYSANVTGGRSNVTLSSSNLPSHTHTFSTSASGTTGAAGGHTHSASTAISDSGHIHSVSDPGHQHGVKVNRTSKGNNATPYMLSDPDNGENFQGTRFLPTTSELTGINLQSAVTGITATTSLSAIGDHQHSLSTSLSGTTDATGGGVAVNIMPPYYALCYIQKMF
jgi:hypothetical protein